MKVLYILPYPDGESFSPRSIILVMQGAIKSTVLTMLFLMFSIAPVFAQLPEDPGGMYVLIERYQADKGSLNRTYKLKTTESYYERMEQFYDGWIDQVKAIDYSALSLAEAIDYTLLKRDIKNDHLALKNEREATAAIRNTVQFENIISAFEKERRVGANIEGAVLAERLDSLAARITQSEQQLRDDKKLSYQDSKQAVSVVGNLREVLKNSYEFYDGYDPDVTWWAAEPFQKADSLLGDYVTFLGDWRADQGNKDDGSGIIGNPIGREAVMQRLENEMIAYTPEELIEIANKEFEWCQTEMLKASRELGYGDNWKAALESVKESYVPAGEQPELIYELATGAINFIEQRDLITIPELAKETWRMTMLSPERQLISPFFLGGEVIQISYPTNTMPHEAKMMSMRGNNPHFSRATVHHELIAGHHLQGFMNNRHRPYRRAFYTPFWVEGWALYWEMRLWDLEFPRNAEDRIGMLFWRMHRSARIIFSLGYHLGEMSPQESIDFLVEKVGHEYANAEAEVRRSFTGNYGPLYQIAYLVGGLQFRALHQQFVVNGAMSDKEFHDAVMQQNYMPVDMVRHVLLDKKPIPDYESDWKFYIPSEEIAKKY